MGAFVVYILEWSACLLGFLLLYKMCLSGTTFHRFNRIYLLGTVVLTAILPLVHIAPSEQMEPMAETCRTIVRVEDGMWDNIHVNDALGTKTENLTVMEKGVLSLLVIYLMYILVQLTGWGKALLKLLRFIHGKRRRRVGRWVWLVEHDAEYGPFSWMNCIVVSTHERGFDRRASVRHELSHIVLLHHIDLVFLMACVIVNPICWIVMKEVKIVHEYEADDEVINHFRIQSRAYQRLLIMRTVGAEAYALASSFNLNIKKRIIMMKKKQSPWWRMTWIAVTIPLIGFTLMAFSKPKEALRAAVDKSVRVMEQPLVEVVKTDLFKTETTTAKAELPNTALAEKPLQPTPSVKTGDIITGSVRKQDGQSLQLANIVEKDENQRIVAYAITDDNGNYSLKVVNPKHKIHISYVGCKSKTLDIDSNQIDVVLEQDMQLSDVQVVAYSDSIDHNSLRYQEVDYVSVDGDGFDIVEQAPFFPGGQAEIMKYLSRHLKYPRVAREMRVEANITVKFTVDKTGFVRSPQVVDISAGSPLLAPETLKALQHDDMDARIAAKDYQDAVEAMKEEAIHVVRNMPRWEPGRQNGKRVETTYTLPINFKLK